MYLNVNLTPPSAGSDSPSSIPKTPEILNSLISLTTPPLPPSYLSYQNQVSRGELQSPTSSASPSDEVSPSQFGSETSPSSSDPCGKCVLTRVSGGFRRIPSSSIAGTPSPPVPELPSPVSTVEATKSALIKEGLKHQIKTKLKAAGIADQELLIESAVKEEKGGTYELTHQDAERRYRRRERNKIAATKCRNKKKEKTLHLMTESESVEDQNIRLKSEIRRLTSEKIHLEKLLGDPGHVASCRRSCSRSGQHRSPPVVVITSPDAPDLLSSTSIEESLPRSNALPSPVQQTLDANSGLSFCTPTAASVCEPTFTADNPRSSSSYHDLSSSSLSPGSLPSTSPPHLILPTTQSHTICSSNVPSTSYDCPTTFLELLPSKESLCISQCHSSLPSTVSVSSYCNPEPFSSDTYLPVKFSHQRATRRHQPYNTGRHIYARPSPYTGHSSIVASEEGIGEVSRTHYLHTSVTEDCGISSKIFPYECQSDSQFLLSPVTDLPCSSVDQTKTTCTVGKIRSATAHTRYNPYNRSDRQQSVLPTVDSFSDCNRRQSPHLIEQVDAPQNIPTTEEFISPSIDMSTQFIMSDIANTQFYPPCTFGDI